jgi:hypothetical protein
MQGTEFTKYWQTRYPEALPINYELKTVYPDRWFRIHSLPESKRYAENESEYQIIFNRQNILINDLFGDNTDIIISFGLYTDDLSSDNYKELTDFGEFDKIQTISLHKERPDEYEDETYFDIYIKSEQWKMNSNNEILKGIADDEIRAMFICPAKDCIIAPYDGGVDIIVNSTEKRDKLKQKYKDWLSEREDGL